jgi:hypothetical protein
MFTRYGPACLLFKHYFRGLASILLN